MEYIALPLTLRKGYFRRIDLKESIRHSVGLILSTRVGTIPFYPEFGSEIWEKEFSDLLTQNKAEIRASLRNALKKFERRLYNISVSFITMKGTTTHPLGLSVKVSGNFRDGNEEKEFNEAFTIG